MINMAALSPEEKALIVAEAHESGEMVSAALASIPDSQGLGGTAE